MKVRGQRFDLVVQRFEWFGLDLISYPALNAPLSLPLLYKTSSSPCRSPDGGGPGHRHGADPRLPAACCKGPTSARGVQLHNGRQPLHCSALVAQCKGGRVASLFISRIGSNQIESDRIKPNRIESDRIGSDPIGSDPKLVLLSQAC